MSPPREIVGPPTRWRRSGETVSVTAVGPTGRIISIADWQSPSQNAEPVRITGSVMGATSSVFLAYCWSYVLRYRIGGLWVEESAPWASQGWVRALVCDEVQVHARLRTDPIDEGGGPLYGPWLIGAGMAGGDGAPNRVSVPLVYFVPTEAEPPAVNIWVPVRPPVGTTRVRLDADSYDGLVGYMHDTGGVVLSAGVYAAPAVAFPAAQFSEFRDWNGQYGLIGYQITAPIVDADLVTAPTWIFEVA